MNLLITQNQTTAKNGLSVSHSFTLREADNDTSTQNRTSGMSAHATNGSFRVFNINQSNRSGVVTGADGTTFTDDASKNSQGMPGIGNFSTYMSPDYYGYHTIKLNVSHTHNIYLRGGVSLGNGDTETKPIDFTYKIWKRTA